MAEPAVRSMLAFLGLVLACGVLIAITAAFTRERIEENRANRFLATLTELAGSVEAAAGVRWTGDVAHLCTGNALLRGTARGYGGDIRWLAAADVSGATPALARLRITGHQETPGIADFLDRPGHGWLASLQGSNAPKLARVDAVSGATITSRGLGRSLAAALRDPRLDERECAP